MTADAPADRGVFCAECGMSVQPGGYRLVDGEPICHRCLFGAAPPLAVWPIGVVRNQLARAGKGVAIGRDTNSEIHLVPGMERFLGGVAEEAALTVIWFAHEAHELQTTFARGVDGKVVGPFAARTPARPNALAITEVRLVEVRGPVLVVSGLDAIDGTPVLDLKVSRESLARESSRPTPSPEERAGIRPVSVRYIVDDLDAAIAFYTGKLGFSVGMHPAPTFAMLVRGNLRLLLSVPSGQGGGGQAMPDGTRPEPGGWNRISLELPDLEGTVEKLRRDGAHFRNDIVVGVGGSQILMSDPAGNCIELFEPRAEPLEPRR